VLVLVVLDLENFDWCDANWRVSLGHVAFLPHPTQLHEYEVREGSTLTVGSTTSYYY
jgi:hypothetical protein